MNSFRKFFTGSTNIYETFYPLNMVLKFFGFIPFTICRHSSKRPLMTFFQGFLLSFWVLLYLFFFTINLFWGQQEPEYETSLLMKHGWHKLYLFQTLMLACLVIFNLTKRLSIIECLRLIDQFDLAEVTTDLMFHLS